MIKFSLEEKKDSLGVQKNERGSVSVTIYPLRRISAIAFT